MLVIISDLHLTDRSSGDTISAGAFRIFMRSLQRLAEQASYRKHENDEFTPIDACHVVLLGDILDVIRSRLWRDPGADQDPRVRPWSPRDTADQAAAFADRVERITRMILEKNQEALAYLQPTLRIQNADGEAFDIPLKIYYMVGNHDWFYHLKGQRYDAIRHELIQAFGLSQKAEEPFPHTLDESPELKRIFDEHRVYAQHGDVHDPLNYQPGKGRDVASFGDAAVIELLNRFPEDVGAELGELADPALVADLKEIDNVRPSLMIPAWIRTTLAKYPPATRRAVIDIWSRQVRSFLRLPFLREVEYPGPFGRVLLRILLKVSDRLGWMRVLAFIQQGVRKISPFFNLDIDSGFVKHVYKEPAYRNDDGSIDYFIYGHTHNPEVVPVQVLDHPGSRRVRLYFNSGTWRTVHQKAERKGGTDGFARYQVMTYVAFYRDDPVHGHERRGRNYEVWNGQLDHPVDPDDG